MERFSTPACASAAARPSGYVCLMSGLSRPAIAADLASPAHDACIDRWLARTGRAEGYRMDLDTLWRFAAGWYQGRLERGYRRREPADAHAYFRQVGLQGPFWGLS